MGRVKMLVINDLHVHYGKVYAIQGISLNVEQGEIVSVLGANGAGKSTLLNTIVGLVKPTTGKILMGEKDITRFPPHQTPELGIGYAPEGRRVFPDFSVHENLIMGAYTVKDKKAIQKNIDNAFTLFPVLGERRKQLAGTLSGGEQQMLAVGRAIMSSPRLLLLDEPSLGLAPKVIDEIFHALVEINQKGTTVLLVEQSAHLALKITNRAYILESGRISLEGTAEELVQNSAIQEVYLGT
jgi:branched-chain amino acid transport system ATP-binding protein